MNDFDHWLKDRLSPHLKPLNLWSLQFLHEELRHTRPNQPLINRVEWAAGLFIYCFYYFM